MRVQVLLPAAALVAAAVLFTACGKETVTAPNSASITLTAYPAKISVGTGVATIEVKVLDGTNIARVGTVVHLRTSLGTLDTDQVETNVEGRAQTLLHAPAAPQTGIATVTGSSGAADDKTVDVLIQAAEGRADRRTEGSDSPKTTKGAAADHRR